MSIEPPAPLRYDRRVATDDAGAEIRTARPSDVEAIAVLHLASRRAAYQGFVSDAVIILSTNLSRQTPGQ
jgi:hypothetical protein